MKNFLILVVQVFVALCTFLFFVLFVKWFGENYIEINVGDNVKCMPSGYTSIFTGEIIEKVGQYVVVKGKDGLSTTFTSVCDKE